MAQLNDTQINGNLNVTEDIQIGDISVTEKLDELNTNMSEIRTLHDTDTQTITNRLNNISITTKTYSHTMPSNAYVSPFSYFQSYGIPESDIALYGEPISISAYENNSAAVPCRFYSDRRQYNIVSKNDARVFAVVVFLKI